MDAEPTDMEPDEIKGQLYHGCLEHAQILLSIGGPGTTIQKAQRRILRQI